jgi:hypothetical protein
VSSYNYSLVSKKKKATITRWLVARGFGLDELGKDETNNAWLMREEGRNVHHRELIQLLSNSSPA